MARTVGSIDLCIFCDQQQYGMYRIIGCWDTSIDEQFGCKSFTFECNIVWYGHFVRSIRIGSWKSGLGIMFSSICIQIDRIEFERICGIKGDCHDQYYCTESSGNQQQSTTSSAGHIRPGCRASHSWSLPQSIGLIVVPQEATTWIRFV